MGEPWHEEFEFALDVVKKGGAIIKDAFHRYLIFKNC